MKDMKNQDIGLVGILTTYIDEHPEIVKCKDDSDCIDCDNYCIFNDTIPKSMELWDYEIKDVDAEVSFNEVRLDILVEASIYLLTGDDQDDGNEIVKHFHVEAMLDFAQFQVKYVGVSVEE